jgi:glucose-6-phosphate-specific signal transduction histidine kinase
MYSQAGVGVNAQACLQRSTAGSGWQSAVQTNRRFFDSSVGSSNLILQVTDNGSGISQYLLEQSEGVGLESMRARAAQIDAKLEIQSAASQGTSIIVTVPVLS